MKSLRHCLGAAVAALCLVTSTSAQLSWSVFNETATTAAPASTALSGVAVSVPAGQRATLVANNLVPIDLTQTGTEALVTISFKVSGGLSGISAGTRAIGFGLFNTNGTATNYADDAGYFTWLNGRNTGSLIEQRRRIGDGTSPSLLNPTGTAFNNMSTGQASPTPGSLNDGNVYSITFHLMSRGGAISFGNTSSNTTGGGIIVTGPGIQAITFSNPDAPASAFVFNEIGLMFVNTTSSPQTLTVTSVSSSNGAFLPINAPAIAAQPASISLNPGQPGALTVGVTGTPPLTYQWKKDGANIAGATAASYNIASAAIADGGSYSVSITNAYGNVTSSTANVTVTTAAIPATITSQPAAVTANIGDNASFAISAFGSSPVTYQWRKDGTNIAGATSTTLSLAKVTAADAGNYTVVVTNASGSTTSNAAALAVNTAPAITAQPISVTTSVGQNVSFSVTATGSPTPSFQWSRNGVAIAGANSATLTLNAVQLANTGVYTVALINDVGAVTSSPAVLAIPSAMVATAVSPANGATNVNVDTPLSITFDRAPVVGTTGTIKVYKASDDTLVDTIDLGASLKQRAVGTNSTLYNFIPVTISGNTATVYVHGGILAYGQTYYVTLDQSAILDSTGASFTGVSDKNAWRFTTKAANTASATAITVAADGSADFTTVQGAIDSVPAGNNQRITITVRKGTYNELVYIGATRPLLTIHGEERAATIVGYANNNNLNGTTATRAAFSIAANDTILENITIKNPTPQGGSQAEAVFTGALRVMLNRVNLLSRQDTLLTNTGTAFITDSYIEGNTDFMWGTAAAYFQRCELKALDTGTATEGYYTQVRNTATTFGNVYVDCKLTAADGVVGKSTYYLGRIDPGTGNFPYSQCMYLNCALGAHISPAGWLLNNATSSATIQYWEYKNTDLNGATIDTSKRLSSSRQLSDGEAVIWRNPAFVLGGWNPQVAATIETPPASQTATAGSIARLTVVANGAPQPALQWFKNGAAIPGANDYTLVIPGVAASDAGNYAVTATNSGGTVTSAAATLTVSRGAYAGTYFGAFGAAVSTTGAPLQTGFALYVRDDGTGVFLASGGGNGGLISRAVTVDSSGNFNFKPIGGNNITVQGTIASNGNVTATIGGVAVTGARSTGASSAFAGYYQTGATSGIAATASIIVGAGGQAFALVPSGAALDGGTGTVDVSGNVAVTTSAGIKVAAAIASNAASATGTITPPTGAAITTAGANDAVAAALRLREFSARAQVTPTSSAAVGFIITGGTDSVLVRAIGPTLADAFAVTGALTNPRLDLYSGATIIASNTNWSTATNASEAAFAASQVGAFPLRTVNADSAIRISLAPGAYTAVMSSANGATTGIGLMEVYDLSVGAAGQRLVNLSSRGPVGNGANALLAGFNVAGTQPKRLLIRGIGPGLTAFGVSGAVAKPVLSVYRGTTLVAQNTGWFTSPDASAITAAAAEAGTFALGAVGTPSADSAVIVNLTPGLYTAQLTSQDATGGTGLIEIYELP